MDKKESEFSHRKIDLPFNGTPIEQDYDILDFLGKGSYGKVYLVKRKLDEKKFAAKVFTKQDNHDPRSKKLESFFRQECDILRSIRHQNIVRFQEFFENKGHIFLVIEYCDGCDLRSFIRKQGKKQLTESETAVVTRAVLRALTFIHNKCNVIHRDVKLGRLHLSSEYSGSQVPIGQFTSDFRRCLSGRLWSLRPASLSVFLEGSSGLRYTGLSLSRATGGTRV